MADNEYGPFASEREALATRAAALIRAAYDAKPGVGASVPEALKVMTDACAECGVDLGRMDLSTLQDIAWRDERGLRYQSDDGHDVTMPYSEDEVRQIQRESSDISPAVRRTVVARQVTPWKEVPGA